MKKTFSSAENHQSFSGDTGKLAPNNTQKAEFDINIPQIILPKGGGAIKGIDEKFSVNASNGTTSITIPFPISKARNDFSPPLSLSYNSGSGNSTFGLGWNLDLQYIQRKTDKQLPQYKDEDESDVFILWGADDLVPSMKLNEENLWIEDEPENLYPNIKVKRYKPRIEASFSRIEKISSGGYSFWKVTTKDNIVTFYGKTSEARIFDPNDDTRIFKWLPELSYDNKGNCIQYSYIEENLANVPDECHERNRHNSLLKFTNKYLKSVRYGNKNAYYPRTDNPYNIDNPTSLEYFFEIVFDYDDHNDTNPLPVPQKQWQCRLDPFSDFRSGFEIRTYRLCRRALFFHYFKELSSEHEITPYLVRSFNFNYKSFYGTDSSLEIEADLLVSLKEYGYRRNGSGGYDKKSLPPMEFEYNTFSWNTEPQSLSQESIKGAPEGLNDNYQWVDFYGEGIDGILTEQNEGWYYKSNLGDGNFSFPKLISPRPSFNGMAKGGLQLLDIEANGKKYIVSNDINMPGYFEQKDNGEWLKFKCFESIPNIDFKDPNVRFIDLSGDGIPDIIITEDDVFIWYQSKGIKGYETPNISRKGFDEERGPVVVFEDSFQTIFLADMSGDGLIDIVRIRNGEICYWPNMGYGRFGAKITMNNSPLFDIPDMFNPEYLYLADISGTGATDILYLGQDRFRAWINLCGNSWSNVKEIEPFFDTSKPNQLSVLDFLGNGTACIVWSSPLPHYINTPMRYIDLMGGKKPYIMCRYKNNLGKETNIQYKSSIFYYLKDKKEGNPWVTKLPFPVQCVSRLETIEKVTNSHFINQFFYHHGFYDSNEREFRGFGMVEQLDTDAYENYVKAGASNIIDEHLHQAPVLTKTWYHTGAFIEKKNILLHYQNEYYKNQEFSEYHLPDAYIDYEGVTEISAKEIKEALRACKSIVLRQEIYALDDSENDKKPYLTAEHSYYIKLLQPMLTNKHAVFLMLERESISYNYERDTKDPRITHSLNLEIDKQGNILKSASIGYPRQVADILLPAEVQAEQSKQHITITQNDFTNDIINDSHYRLRLHCEKSSYELTGTQPLNEYYRVRELNQYFENAQFAQNHMNSSEGITERRILDKARTLFLKNDLSGTLPLKQMQHLGLVYKTYKMAYTKPMLDFIYNRNVDSMLSEGCCCLSEDLKAEGIFPESDDNNQWWVPSDTHGYPLDSDQHFYLPDRYIDPYGFITKVKYYDDYNLFISETEDAAGNKAMVESFDFRVLQPERIKDINDNISEVRYDLLGFVAATVVKGKGSQGDDFSEFKVDLDESEIEEFFNYPSANGINLLKHASTRFIYNFDVIPSWTAVIARDTHYQDGLLPGNTVQLYYGFEYFNGLGTAAMKKAQAEPGVARYLDNNSNVVEVDTGTNLRWVGSGRTVYNNKNKPVKQYEPYFSITHKYEAAAKLVEIGVSPVMYYDAIGRLVKTEYPNGTYSKVVFDTWLQKTYDANDTVEDSQWYIKRTSGSLAANVNENSSAVKTGYHNDTPLIEYFDSLGRSIYSLLHNKYKDTSADLVVDEKYPTIIKLDILGNICLIKDARNNSVIEYKYNMLNDHVYKKSMDAGEQWVIKNALEKIIYKWDSDNTLLNYKYDSLHRNTELLVTRNGKTFTPKRLIYGEGITDAKNYNLRGEIYKKYDGFGVLTNESYDFKGNLKSFSREICKKYEDVIDWTDIDVVELVDSKYTTSINYDALNRQTRIVKPDHSAIKNIYNQASLLNEIRVKVKDGAEEAYVTNIDYNEKGQRVKIQYGNNTSTIYTYDKNTFKLVQLLTEKTAEPRVLQNLNYTYDPVGNITNIEDLANQNNFYTGDTIPPQNSYTYDALYRLISATGREYEQDSIPFDEYDNARKLNSCTNSPNSLSNYAQQYVYDSVGNIQRIVHSPQNSEAINWIRSFSYKADNNHLLSIRTGDVIGEYSYDSNGNITRMPHLDILEWDYEYRLRAVEPSESNNETELLKEIYVYDYEGERCRKIAIYPENLIKERLYFDGFEIYREIDGESTILERETLHVEDDRRHIAIVETDTIENGHEVTDALPFVRYQLDNQLGTACIELDSSAELISYEEYYPYGSTSYQAIRNEQGQTPEKRYRFVGKERDSESGFYYIGERYYAPWIIRWTSPDALLEKNYKQSSYVYCNCNPITLIDPDGRDAVYIAFPDFRPEIYGYRPLALGHAGVLLIDNRTGLTRYYEYGRYDPAQLGLVQTIRGGVPNVVIGADGRPTPASLNNVLAHISRAAGHGGRIEGAYVESTQFTAMDNYARRRMAQNSDPARTPYSLSSNNCGTFAHDVIGQDPSVSRPWVVNPSPTNFVDEYREEGHRRIDYNPTAVPARAPAAPRPRPQAPTPARQPTRRQPAPGRPSTPPRQRRQQPRQRRQPRSQRRGTAPAQRQRRH
ncbi:MAG: SpvB/TcaC N-terminal domain-containing protein [Deltaproteobacteria bacterium]